MSRLGDFAPLFKSRRAMRVDNPDLYRAVARMNTPRMKKTGSEPKYEKALPVGTTPIMAGATRANSPVMGIGNNCVTHKKMHAANTANARKPLTERPCGGVSK